MKSVDKKIKDKISGKMFLLVRREIEDRTRELVAEEICMTSDFYGLLVFLGTPMMLELNGRLKMNRGII